MRHISGKPAARTPALPLSIHRRWLAESVAKQLRALIELIGGDKHARIARSKPVYREPIPAASIQLSMRCALQSFTKLLAPALMCRTRTARSSMCTHADRRRRLRCQARLERSPADVQNGRVHSLFDQSRRADPHPLSSHCRNQQLPVASCRSKTRWPRPRACPFRVSASLRAEPVALGLLDHRNLPRARAARRRLLRDNALSACATPIAGSICMGSSIRRNGDILPLPRKTAHRRFLSIEVKESC